MFPIEEKVKRVLAVTFFLNLFVCVAKLTYGAKTHSLSLTADGFHSLFDSLSNVIAYIAMMMAFKPADEGHPYGHRKLETLASLGIALLLFGTCFELITMIINRFRQPEPTTVDFLSFVIMGFTIIVNYSVSRYELKKGYELKSDILLADGTHTKTDMLVSTLVIISFVGVLARFPLLDVFIACGIVFFIIYAAIKILYLNLNILLDARSIDPRLVEKTVMSIPGIYLCHKIRSRGTRNGIFVDLHIHVNPGLSTVEAHHLTHEVITTIKNKYPEVLDVLIHTEPAYTPNKEG